LSLSFAPDCILSDDGGVVATAPGRYLSAVTQRAAARRLGPGRSVIFSAAPPPRPLSLARRTCHYFPFIVLYVFRQAEHGFDDEKSI